MHIYIYEFSHTGKWLEDHTPGDYTVKRNLDTWKYLKKNDSGSKFFFNRPCDVVVYCPFRLEAYERNKKFGQPDIAEPDSTIEVLEASLHKDINADLDFCPFSMENVVNYLNQYDKTVKQSKNFMIIQC